MSLGTVAVLPGRRTPVTSNSKGAQRVLRDAYIVSGVHETLLQLPEVCENQAPELYGRQHRRSSSPVTRKWASRTTRGNPADVTDMSVTESFTLLSIALCIIVLRTWYRWSQVGFRGLAVDDYLMPVCGVSLKAHWKALANKARNERWC